MKFILLTLIAASTLLSSCNTTPQPETGPGHPVQLPPPTVPEDPDYDPHLLIPQWDWQTQKWGYIDRTSREAVIPHIFRAAGRLQRGVAYATAPNEDETVEDVYRITADGQYKRIHEGNAEYWNGKRRRYQYSRLGDDYFFINQGDYSAMHDPDGNRLWDTIGNWANFVLSGELPAYLGNGHIALSKDGYYDFRDRDFKTVARFDTTEYLIFFPNEMYDWVRTSHQIPLIPALDLKTDKMGFLDKSGATRIAFQYDRSESLEIRNVRSSTLASGQYSYRFDRLGHALVFQDDTPTLIDITGKVIYECPDSLWFASDPVQCFNRTENSILLQSRNTGWDHIIDLDDDKVVFSGQFLYKLDDTKYLVEEGRGRENHVEKMVDQYGVEIPFEYGDRDCSLMYSTSNNNGFWVLWDRGIRKNILTNKGETIGSWKFESIDFDSDHTENPFFVFQNRETSEGIFRTEYTLVQVFAASGDSVTSIMKDVTVLSDEYFLGKTSLSNGNWNFETAANMLFYLEFVWKEHRCQGYIDALGHYFILD